MIRADGTARAIDRTIGAMIAATATTGAIANIGVIATGIVQTDRGRIVRAAPIRSIGQNRNPSLRGPGLRGSL